MNGRTRFDRLALAGAAAGIALVIAGPATAVPNVINACYQKVNGQLRLLSAGQQCLPSEVAISWDLQGPTGPTGPQGAPGISGLERVDYSSKDDSTSPKHAFAKCPSGKQVVGGGAQVFMETGESGPVALKKSFPSKAMDGWAATAEEMVATDANWFVSAYALCATVAP